jgi:hypothetical protein
VIADPAPNTITHPYRGLSVQETDVPLTAVAVEELLLGREIYRRTEYLVLRNGGRTALIGLRVLSREPLFTPVSEVRMLSGPDTTVWIDDDRVDVGNASSLARAALSRDADGALAYVVRGRHEHVNFIWRPAPIRIRVTEVVPPQPAKLFSMAAQAIAFDEELPPIELVLDAVDIRELAAANSADRYLLPCRGSGIDLPGAVSFLDTRPADRADWLLIGCERSQQFHRHFYGDDSRQVDLCPRARSVGIAGELMLSKCCLIERGIEVASEVAVVPWGSNLDEVRAALRALCGLKPPARVVEVPTEAGR